MTTFVALLRGINVGGNRKVAMADLRAIFLEAGCEGAQTYIQSGNVIFESPRTEEDLRLALERGIESATGFTVPVVMRTAAELAAVVEDNPFPDADPARLVVAFLGAPPDPEVLKALESTAVGDEALVSRGRDLYLHLPGGFGRSRLAQSLGTVAPATTARNWRTVTKLLELASR